jgi:hypothetical protein
VGVLTFHRCINYGSYWQARAIVEGLRRRGHEAVLLDHHSRRVNSAESRNALRPVLPRRTPRNDFPLYARKVRKFLDAFDRLPLSQPFPLERPSAMEPHDVVVVGSDEVWNFRHPWYAACPIFFGEGVRAERLVSYAASFGCHDASTSLDPIWVGRLQRFAAIAVRDENSRRLIREGLGREPALVLDPCLQFDDVCRRPTNQSSDHAIVYGHGFPDDFARAVRSWASARGVRLISLGYRNDWADEQRLTAGPEEFAQAMGAARAVATNFFHGCIFALVNDKPFVCTPTDYRWHKLHALVHAVAAEDRLVDKWAPQAAFDGALDDPLTAVTRESVAALRQRSTEYLENALR